MSTAALASGSRFSRVAHRSPPLSLVDVVDLASFAELRGEWDALVDASSPIPFCRHGYVHSFLHNFAPAASLKIVTGRDARGRLAVALPLLGARGRICGIPVRELASPTNVHSLRFDLVAAGGDASGEAVMRHLAADESWDVLRITDIPPDGQAWGVYRAAQAAGFPVGAWEAQRSSYIELPRCHDVLMRGLRPKFRANLRRRRKRLAEAGEVSIERLAGGALTERHLEGCLVLERSGWKGRQGSAIAQSPEAHGFHLELLRTAALREQLSLYLLKLAGEPIAFHYGLTSRGVYSLVMTSYDERFKAFSPGHLLTEEVLGDCARRGLREFDFLGCDLPWKRDWTSTVRPHHWLFIFRDSLLGRALRALKFGRGRAAYEWLDGWRARLAPGRARKGRLA